MAVRTGWDLEMAVRCGAGEVRDGAGEVSRRGGAWRRAELVDGCERGDEVEKKRGVKTHWRGEFDGEAESGGT